MKITDIRAIEPSDQKRGDRRFSPKHLSPSQNLF
ncbi:hypothetical protein GGP55_002840 [Salinibacter ruber]|nr:hypothetical protein [Salinibacter ruber]MCS3632224.1 hypothetical protein [Salinibacter ruber]MCS3663389.1 hypothetical protein [Salinibacter ruber]MCS3752723.1 hypothetical protein [Salinibacter ruber]MCS4039991.1 hypothetical protein [Salinibacter ruber]